MSISQSNTPSSDINANGAREMFKHSACDRCRGQKLRCIRNNNNQDSCSRCERARAICVTKPTLRIGRPSRAEISRRRELMTIERGQQSTRSSTLSSSTQKPSPVQATSSNDNSTLWVGEVDEADAMDAADPMSRLYNGILGIDDSILEDEFDLFGPASTFDGAHDLASSHTLLNASHFNPSYTSQAPDSTQHSPRDSITQDLESNFEEMIDDSPVAGTKLVNETDTTSSSILDAYHTSIERLSKLNIEFYQQLRLTGATTDQGSALSLSSSNKNKVEPPLPIAIMIRGLQSFQELLHDILSSHARLCASTTTNITATIHEPTFAINGTSWQHKRLGPSHLSTSTKNKGDDSLFSSSLNTTHSYSTLSSDGLRLISQSNDRQAQIRQLDLPTSLLIITCYINLVRLCRNVFFNIRLCLLTLDRKAIFATLSNLQISGVSLQQDTSLQIMVLVQVVVRLLDRIGSSIGCPNDTSICGAQRDEEPLPNKVIAPKLIDSVLREEESDGQGFYSGGIKALREEIRRLRKVLNQI